MSETPAPASPPSPQPIRLRTWLLGLAVWAATLVLGSWLLSISPGQEKLGGDFPAFWGAAKSLRAGENPYDPQNLRRHAADAGGAFQKAHLQGRFDQIPFYYPPWSVYPAVALLPLGYDSARNVWMTLGLQAWIASVVLLARRPGAFPFLVRLVIFGGAAWWIVSLRLGQVVAPTLLLLVLCLTAWEQGRDRWTGVFLALAVVKPQIAGLPALLVLLAAARDRRWNVWISAAACGAALALSACWFRPTWIFEFLAAPRLNPPPTAVDGLHTGPQLGCSLWSNLMLLFGSFGGGASASAVGNGLAAAVAIQAVVAAAILIPLANLVRRRENSMERLIAAGVLASWFLSPYMRFYDLPMLCLPAAHLLNRRLTETSKALFAAVWVVGPPLDGLLDYAQLLGSKDHPLVALLDTQSHLWWLAVFVGFVWIVDVFHPEPRADAPQDAEGPPPEQTAGGEDAASVRPLP